MTADHVLAAMKDIEFEHMLPDLEASLENYRQIIKNKKERKSMGNVEKAAEEETDDVEMVETVDE
jgi:hypothetical protein